MLTASARPLEKLLSHLSGVRPDGLHSWKAYCPLHENDGRPHDPSLQVTEAQDGKVLIYCHVCKFPDMGARVCDAFALPIRDLFPKLDQRESSRIGTSKTRIVATYNYHDEAGQLLFQVVRLDPKSFRQRRPDGNGGWDWSVKGVRRVPYNLLEIIRRPDERIVIVEGEKDADNLLRIGLLATCNSGGAGKWPADEEYNACFRGRRVVILPDQDDPGRAHAAAVASILNPIAANVRVINFG